MYGTKNNPFLNLPGSLTSCVFYLSTLYHSHLVTVFHLSKNLLILSFYCTLIIILPIHHLHFNSRSLQNHFITSHFVFGDEKCV